MCYIACLVVIHNARAIMHNVCKLVLDSLYYLVHNHHLDPMYNAYMYVHNSRRDNHVMTSRNPTRIRNRSLACF